jgi:hypothetical protein
MHLIVRESAVADVGIREGGCGIRGEVNAVRLVRVKGSDAGITAVVSAA